MKFTTKDVTQGVTILANDHYVAIPYDCSKITATNGVIKAGTIIPSNDDKAIGVLLNDVYPAENSNGTIVIHGLLKRQNCLFHLQRIPHPKALQP